MNEETQTFSPLSQPSTRTDAIAKVIKSAILAGKLKPGDALVERRIAEDLGVSKTPVREALISLAQGGLVELARNRGTFVREMSIQNFIEVYQARLLLEPWAVAESIGARRLADAEVQTARKLLDSPAEKDAADAGHGESIVMAQQALRNREFHRLLYRNCSNSLVVQNLDGLQDLAALAAVTYWEKISTWDQESDEHQRMLNAAMEGDVRTLKSVLTKHIESSLENISKSER